VARTELDNLKFWALEHPRKSGLYIYNPN
jgi:hypothetical protein